MLEKSTPVPTAACTAGSAAVHDVLRVTNKPPSVAVTRLCSPVWASEGHSVAGRSVAAPDLLHSLHRLFWRLCSQMQLPPVPAALQALQIVLLQPCLQMLRRCNNGNEGRTFMSGKVFPDFDRSSRTNSPSIVISRSCSPGWILTTVNFITNWLFSNAAANPSPFRINVRFGLSSEKAPGVDADIKRKLRSQGGHKQLEDTHSCVFHVCEKKCRGREKQHFVYVSKTCL